MSNDKKTVSLPTITRNIIKFKYMEMKKLFFTCILALAAMAAHSQSLFNTVYDTALKKVNSADTPTEAVQVNQFEVTALNYIQLQVSKRGLDKNGYFFDSQAVNLKSFVDDFLYYLEKARISPAKRMEVIACYRDASLNNPLFNDSDKETVYCFVNDKKTYTPFSLDTDWEKAYDQASAKIRTIIK